MNLIKGLGLPVLLAGTIGLASCKDHIDERYIQTREFVKSSMPADQFAKLENKILKVSDHEGYKPTTVFGTFTDVKCIEMEKISDSIKWKNAFNEGKAFVLDSIKNAAKHIRK